MRPHLQEVNRAAHRALSEELKHLYTAITRAKNSVVFLDTDPEARAPFYYFLKRLGLATLVDKPLIEVGGWLSVGVGEWCGVGWGGVGWGGVGCEVVGRGLVELAGLQMLGH